MIIKKFTLYSPENADVPGAMYLKSEDGRDWYESQSLFSADTLKVAYDSNGIICGISKDVSVMWPVNMSVAEVPDSEENRKADSSGRWKFDGERIVDTLTAEKARGLKGDEINAWRNAMEAANYTFEHNGRKWDYGKSTQTRLEPSVAAAKAGKLPEAFFWTDADNNDVPMDAETLIALSAAAEQAMFTKGMEIHVRQRTMKKELEKLTSADEILAYRVGWAQE